MSWLWITALLSAGVWLFLLRVFVEPSVAVGSVLVALAAVAAGIGTRRARSPRLSARAAVVLSLLLVIVIGLWPLARTTQARLDPEQESNVALAKDRPNAVLVSLVQRVPAALALAGVLLWACPRHLSGLRELGRPLLIVAAMMTAAYGGLLGYVWIASRGHVSTDAGPVVHAMTELLRMPMAYFDGWLTLETMRAAHTFPASWELLGLPMALPLLVIGLPLAALWGRRRAGFDMLIFTIGLGGWVCFRAALIIAFYENEAMLTGYHDKFALMGILWHPWAFFVSFVPVALLLVRLVPLRSRAAEVAAAASPAPLTEEQRARLSARLGTPPAAPGVATHVAVDAVDEVEKTGAAGPVIGAVGAALLVVAYGWCDPGVRKAGRIVMDENHSRWERSDRPYDTEWYGHESGYNYAAIYDYLDRHYPMGRNYEDWTPERLKDVDVLILKNPTEAYSKEEIDAIEQFVRNGGGVWLVGEHTNVFGTSSYLNPIGRRFGAVFNDDVCFDIVNKFVQTFYSPRVLRHPTIIDMPWFRFETSCSVAVAGLGGRAAVTGWALKALHSDYHIPNFYPMPEDQASMKFGPFIQLYAKRFGSGRVAAFSDSTCYSNFSAFEKGKPEMLLGTVEWLNRRNRFVSLLWQVAAGAGAGLIVLGLAISWRRRSAGMLALAVVVAGWATVTAEVVDYVNRRNYRAPAPRRELVRIGFDREHGRYALSDGGFIRASANSFALLNQWALRVGQFPFRHDRFKDALANSEVVVVINATQPFSATEVRRAKAFVEQGGRLLVLDDLSNANSQVNRLLRAFGAKITSGKPESGYLTTPAGRRWGIPASGRAIEGGRALLLVGDVPVASVIESGRGRCVVISCASVFSDEQMGRSDHTIPSPALRHRFELVYTLWRNLSSSEPMTLGPAQITPAVPRVTQPTTLMPVVTRPAAR